ncbi:hypothetical protein U1Q18_038798 [Sarracenia purpurea var. burkii]
MLNLKKQISSTGRIWIWICWWPMNASEEGEETKSKTGRLFDAKSEWRRRWLSNQNGGGGAFEEEETKSKTSRLFDDETTRLFVVGSDLNEEGGGGASKEEKEMKSKTG